MRLNNKGFAISSMMYSILLLFLMLILGVFAMLGSRKVILDKVKSEVVTELTQNKTYVFTFDHQNILLANTSKVNNFNFTLLDGVKIVDQNGNIVETTIDVNSEPAFDSTVNGTYRVSYTATHQGYLIEAERIIEVVDPVTYEYAYTGGEQQFSVPANGIYRTELWGASGMSQTTEGRAGRGAYVRGDISFDAGMNLYLYVGNLPGWGNAFNSVPGSVNGFSGGGATDLRLVNGEWHNFNSLKSRIMVAGGGGGSEWPYSVGGDAGGLIGETGYGTDWSATLQSIRATGGTQTSGGLYNTDTGDQITPGNNGGFGIAGYNRESSDYGGMGGGGYYGGASKEHSYAGGGGSSFISGHTGCDAILESSVENNIVHSNQPVHYSGYSFNNSDMKSGNETMPTHDGVSTMVGNSGDGHAKITVLIVDSGKVATNLIQNSSFENGSDNWLLSGTEITANVSKTGKNSIQFNPNVTATSTQSMNTPIANHIYYGGLQFLSSNTFTTADSRFEWFIGDAPNSMMVFSWKNEKAPTWKKLTNRTSLDAPNSGNWVIRNFLVNPNEISYADDLFIIDLTEIYGAGNEPSKEWCDSNIKYFDGRGIVPSY